MSFKIFIFAAAVFTCQVKAQMGGIVRPFVTGFNNGLNEMARPFPQFGQSVMIPPREYMSSNRRPQIPQWMSYPSQMIPQSQTGLYEVEAPSGLPGSNYFPMGRPNQAFQPKPPYFPMGNRPGMLGPRPPYPPRPAPGPEFFPGPTPGPAPGFFPGAAPELAPGPTSGPAPEVVPEPIPSSEETEEIYTPSNLLIQPDTELESETPEELPVDGNVEIPTLQRPLPLPEDQE